MQRLRIQATKYTPEIDFDDTANRLDIRGKSYPENTAEFYGPVFNWINTYLDQKSDAPITVNMEIVYFNSSSSKVLMNLFDILEEAVKEGRQITVNWIFDPEDESILEYGEEFKEDIEVLDFRLVPKQ